MDNPLDVAHSRWSASRSETDFDEFYKQLHAQVSKIVRFFPASFDDAELVVDEVVWHIYSKLEQFKGDSKFSTWSYRIARNECVTLKRRETSRAGIGAEPIDGITARLGEDSPMPLRMELAEIRERLTPAEARVWDLLSEGCTAPEIAQALGIRADAARQRIHRLREKLQRPAPAATPEGSALRRASTRPVGKQRAWRNQWLIESKVA